MRDFTAHNAQDGRAEARCVGEAVHGYFGAAVLGLENGAEEDGQKGGAEPVCLDGEFISIWCLLKIEAGDAGVKNGKVDAEVRRVSRASGKIGDAGVICQVDRPDFNDWLMLAPGLLQGREEGGLGFLAFGCVADGEDET